LKLLHFYLTNLPEQLTDNSNVTVGSEGNLVEFLNSLFVAPKESVFGTAYAEA
jgi:hypothetical protein